MPYRGLVLMFNLKETVKLSPQPHSAVGFGCGQEHGSSRSVTNRFQLRDQRQVLLFDVNIDTVNMEDFVVRCDISAHWFHT